MSNIIPLHDARDTLIARRWAAYMAARQAYANAKLTSDRSKQIEDGVATARAFFRFLRCVESLRRPVTDMDIDRPSLVFISDLASALVARARARGGAK